MKKENEVEIGEWNRQWTWLCTSYTLVGLAKIL